ETQLRRASLQILDECTSDAVMQVVLPDEQRAHLAEVLPHDVQRAASDQLAIQFGDDELLHGAVQHREVLAEQDASLDQRLQEPVDAADVGGARRSDGVLAHSSTLEPGGL